MRDNMVLGIDIGSVSAAIVIVDSTSTVRASDYRFHYGKPREVLRDMISSLRLTEPIPIACTSSTPDILHDPVRVNDRIAHITAARSIHGRIGALLVVGGEKFGLALFDEAGEYRTYRANTSCAAGTGSFLDQQARRLNLAGIEEFAALAQSNTGQIPRIASRCAVFAKTDLTHAQQEGYSLPEICDGLSHGMAKNICDTVFSNIDIPAPLLLAGGVARNGAVARHIGALAGIVPVVDDRAHLYGAMGAALTALESARTGPRLPSANARDIIRAERETERAYHYPALDCALTRYPDFASWRRFEYAPRRIPGAAPIEIDIYRPLAAGERLRVFLGIDIGSTSTKAAVVLADREMLAGLYTRTAGRPLEAVQAIFEALETIGDEHGVRFDVAGAGTTGSGRKFIGGIIGADLVLDEISAHARAACELDPAVDTIIEIGGQDAKFTTLRDGTVTFSVMNTVCAAGTGSFIEEQAAKLGCALADFARRAAGQCAPLSSDRCTVFMERDLNHYLAEGFAVDEVLASVLHSVRDNYLLKVAVEGAIGRRIFFQGATAKNRALVAAFEQRLGKPITVSPYCHLTGAYGAALTLIDSGAAETTFRGIGLHREEIPVRSEACDLCANHCKLKCAEVAGETVAYGFLCGRDYATNAFVSRNASGFDLIKERATAFARKKRPSRHAATVGIPAALYLAEELPLWKMFFDELGIPTVTSEHYRDALKTGKRHTGAEFCAPIAAFHGHVMHLADKADYLFVPTYLEARNSAGDGRRQYCYYTQFMPPLIASIKGFDPARIVSPLVNSIHGALHQKVQLYKAVKTITGGATGFLEVSAAYDAAAAFHAQRLAQLRETFTREIADAGDISVVLLGRPYTVLSKHMNNNIPGIFAANGVKAFFQDMLPVEGAAPAAMRPLLETFHWKYAASVLQSAEYVARTDGVYPVLVTSFKCSPDSFTVEHFKDIMGGRGKPYLVLQLDEHDSSVGYETRIEAAIRSFRNHHAARRTPLPSAAALLPSNITDERSVLDGRTLLIPGWDPVNCDLLAAVLTSEGIDARVLEETPDSIRRSLRHNTGQCIPLTAVAQNCIDYVERHGLDPARTALWMFNANIACNVRLFPSYIKRILDAHGMERLSVYVGDMTFIDLSVKTAVNAYFANLFGGMIRKISCGMRPHEVDPGDTDRAAVDALVFFRNALSRATSKERAVREAVARFAEVRVRRTPKPKVAIFGDVYTRYNDVMNQGLIRTIEDNGGEVVITPFSEYMMMVADPYIYKWFHEGCYSDAAIARLLKTVIPALEERYHRIFREVLDEPARRHRIDRDAILRQFVMDPLHTGESMENLYKIFTLAEAHPDLSLFVQANPAFCCPSLVTQAMSDRIESLTGIPVVTIEYDGIGGFKNESVIPYLRFPRERRVPDALRAAE